MVDKLLENQGAECQVAVVCGAESQIHQPLGGPECKGGDLIIVFQLHQAG